MKIGIVTLPLRNNYGGVLQNWALQQVLKDMGHCPITIDVCVQYSLNRYILSTLLTYIYRIVGKNRTLWPRPYHNRLCSKVIGRFIEKNINMTMPLSDFSSSLVENLALNAIVVGSDQVWRSKYLVGKLEDMFLQFANDEDIKRVVYGASFGIDKWELTEKQTKTCRELVKKFIAISVREKSGVILCKNYLDVEARLVLDPTLLLDVNKYKELCKECPCDSSKNLVVYCLDNFDERKQYFKNLAKENKLKLHMFSANTNVSLTIEQWLALFRDASIIITDSFHGTIFSIIFQKPFYTIINEDRGTTRFSSLLSLLGLENRIFNNELDLFQDIDWKEVDSKLVKLKKESIKFLKESLQQT